jgi:hypothetical protein
MKRVYHVEVIDFAVGTPVSWRKLDSYSSKAAAIARRDELAANGWPAKRVRIC